MQSVSLQITPSGWKSIKNCREITGAYYFAAVPWSGDCPVTVEGFSERLHCEKNYSLRSVIDFLALIEGLGGQLQAQLFKDIDVHAGEHDRGVNLAAPQLGELL